MSARAKLKVKVRRWTPDDIPALVSCHQAAYTDYPAHTLYDERTYGMQLAAFPEGQLLAEVEGRVVGYATSIIVQIDDDAPGYRYSEITGASSFSTHNPVGDTLYGADIAVHPDYRGRGVAGQLYVHRKRLLKKYNLRRMLAHGRIPDFRHHAGKMTADEYVRQVEAGALSDSALNAHFKAGYQVRRVLMDYMQDESSLNVCTLLELPNPDFNPAKRQIAAAPVNRPSRKIRVCAAQYLMRPISAWEEFEAVVDFFACTAHEYHSHYLVMPEFFTAQLMSTMPPELSELEAIQRLAGYADRYVDLFYRKAREYQLYIIAGSTPVQREDGLYNVAHLFAPSGQHYTQDKMHVTPTERNEWGMRPGRELCVFETPHVRLAIQICYDIEFPEASRLLTLAGAEVFFVPFHTDERKAYGRVRFCAHARAVENYIYVVIAGNVGRLTSANYLLNYGQSAILTPSDFAFPLRATAGEADPNVETVVISDLDLTSLEQQREIGSVRPLYDRRPDLYELAANIPIRRVRVE